MNFQIARIILFGRRQTVFKDRSLKTVFATYQQAVLMKKFRLSQHFLLDN